MTRRVVVLCLGAALTATWSAAGPAPPAALQTCSASTRNDILPGVIAPAAGEGPVWFVGGGGRMYGPEAPVKSVWVLDRSVPGALRITGRRLEDNRPLRFREGMDGPFTNELMIATPATHSVTPGGASKDVMSKFAFVMSYVMYPGPGCWEVDARLGEQQTKIVVAVER